MQILELLLDEDQMASGIDAISIVKSPAIESNFVALNNHKVKFATVDAEKIRPSINTKQTNLSQPRWNGVLLLLLKSNCKESK